jgi:hypothetical protein
MKLTNLYVNTLNLVVLGALSFTLATPVLAGDWTHAVQGLTNADDETLYGLQETFSQKIETADEAKFARWMGRFDTINTIIEIKKYSSLDLDAVKAMLLEKAAPKAPLVQLTVEGQRADILRQIDSNPSDDEIVRLVGRLADLDAQEAPVAAPIVEARGNQRAPRPQPQFGSMLDEFNARFGRNQYDSDPNRLSTSGAVRPANRN